MRSLGFDVPYRDIPHDSPELGDCPDDVREADEVCELDGETDVLSESEPDGEQADEFQVTLTIAGDYRAVLKFLRARRRG